MFKRSTWILLAMLALAVGAYFLIKNHPFAATKPTPTATEVAHLITQSDGALQSLHIFDESGHNVKMQRDMSKNWVIIAPTAGVADQASASEAETQIDALSIVTSLDTPPDPDTIGLLAPSFIMELGFVNGASHRIEVGNMTPTSSGYYVRFDGKTYVVDQSGIDALRNLLTAPPYPATATPAETDASVSTPTP